MEKFITHEIEKKPNGSKIVRNFFICENKQNLIKETHKEFSKQQKKEAKLNFKLALKNNKYYFEKRNELIKSLVNYTIPNFNLKFSSLNFKN